MASKRKARTVRENGITWHLDPFQSDTARKAEHCVAVFDHVGKALELISTKSQNTAIRSSMSAMALEIDDKADNFYGHKTLREAKSEAIRGNAETASEARELIDRLGAATIATQRRKRRSSVIGSRVCIPAYLSGAPNPMRRYVTENDNTAPLSIVVNGTSSAAIGAYSLFLRGVAIAALVQKMSLSRPVKLYLAVSGKCTGSLRAPSTIALVKFPTTPVDLTRLAHLMADQGYNRGIGFMLFHAMIGKYLELIGDTDRDGENKGSIRWPFNNGNYIARGNGGDCLERDLQIIMPGEVLYLAGSFIHSGDFAKCLADPVKWINDTVANYTKL